MSVINCIDLTFNDCINLTIIYFINLTVFGFINLLVIPCIDLTIINIIDCITLGKRFEIICFVPPLLDNIYRHYWIIMAAKLWWRCHCFAMCQCNNVTNCPREKIQHNNIFFNRMQWNNLVGGKGGVYSSQKQITKMQNTLASHKLPRLPIVLG